MLSSRSRSRARPWVSFAVLSASLLLTRASFADHYTVPSGSMEPTVHVSDRVVVLKAAYGLRLPFSDSYLLGPRTPDRGDVVVLSSPEDGKVLLKRVVATGGDSVCVTNGHVRVRPRGATSDDPYEDEPSTYTLSLALGGGPDLAPIMVPEGKVLVLGDNRGNSHDGRAFGWVDEHALLGKVSLVVGSSGARTP
jgi:signal peptidase I